MPSQLAPFNQHQFDRCMQWFLKYHGPLTQIQMLKLHVMTDVFHVLQHGSPVIGGDLRKWEWGPLVPSAWGHLNQETKRYQQGITPYSFAVEPTKSNANMFSVPENTAVDEDEFSPSEIQAMKRAWKTIGGSRWKQIERFFHSPENFMGKAWTDAGPKNSPIDWNEIIEAYDEKSGEDHSHIKSLIAMGI